MNLYPDEYSLAKEYVDSHWSDSSSIKRLSFGSSTSTGEEAISLVTDIDGPNYKR